MDERYTVYYKSNDRGRLTVDILVFASPTGYMLTSSGFPLIKSGYIYIYFIFSQPVHLQLTASSPQSLDRSLSPLEGTLNFSTHRDATREDLT